MRFISSILVVLFGCISCLNTSSSPSDVTIKLPTNLPDNIKNGGYSVCVERIDTSDSSCTESYLMHRNFDDVAIDLNVNSNCQKGYRVKMWLWGDSSSKTPLYGLNPKKSSSSFSYQNGYLILTYNDLANDKLTLGLNFLPVSSSNSSSSSSSSSGWEDFFTSITGGGSSPSSNTVSVDTSCNSEGNEKNYAKNNSSSNGESLDAPTGSIISLGTSTPNIKASSYPSMVIYTFSSGCSPCEQLKSWVASNGSMFKSKIYVYQNDVPYGDSSVSNCSGGGARPVVEFYDKSGSRTSDCVVGFNQSQIKQAIQRLTN